MIQNDIKDLLTTAKDMLRENIDTVPAQGCRREEVLEIVTQIENIIIAHGINTQGAIECEPVSIRRCSIYVDWEIEKESYYCRQPAAWYSKLRWFCGDFSLHKPFSDELNIYWCTEHKDYSEGSNPSGRYDPDHVFFELELS